MSDLQEIVGGFREQQVRRPPVPEDVRGRVGALVEHVLAHDHDVPRTGLRRFETHWLACLRVQSHGAVQPQPVRPDGDGQRRPNDARRRGQLQRLAGCHTVDTQQAEGFVLGMVPQHDPARRARGIAFLVVQPERAVGLPHRGDGGLEPLPRRGIFEVAGERHVGRDTAESPSEVAQDRHPRGFGIRRPVMVDPQDPRRAGRGGEPLRRGTILGRKSQHLTAEIRGQQAEHRPLQPARSSQIGDPHCHCVDFAVTHEFRWHIVPPRLQHRPLDPRPGSANEPPVDEGPVLVVDLPESQHQRLARPGGRDGHLPPIPRHAVVIGVPHLWMGRLRRLPRPRFGDALRLPESGRPQRAPIGVVELRQSPAVRLADGPGIGGEPPRAVEIVERQRQFRTGGCGGDQKRQMREQDQHG